MTRRNYLFKYQQLLFALLAMVLSYGAQAQCAPGAITLIYEDFEESCGTKPVGWTFENTGIGGTAAWEYNNAAVGVNGVQINPNGTCWARFDDNAAAGLNTGTVMSPIFNPSGLDDVVISFQYAFNWRSGGSNDAVYLWVEDLDTGDRRYKKSTAGYQGSITPWLSGANAEGTITNFLSALLPADFMSGPIQIGIEFTDDNGQANQFAFDDFSLCGVEKACTMDDVELINEDFEPYGAFNAANLNFASGAWNFGDSIWMNSPGRAQETSWASIHDNSGGGTGSGLLIVKNITGYSAYNLSFFYEFDERGGAGNGNDQVFLSAINDSDGGNTVYWDNTGWVSGSMPWMSNVDRIGMFNESLPAGFVTSASDIIRIRFSYSVLAGQGNGFGVDNIRVCGTPQCGITIANVTPQDAVDCNGNPGGGQIELTAPFNSGATYTVTLQGGGDPTTSGILAGNLIFFSAPVGSYTGLQLESSDGCIGDYNTAFAIDEPDHVATLTLNAMGPTCDEANGEITVVPTMNSNFDANELTYEWDNNNGTTATITDLAQGSYTVTATYGNTGCTYTATTSLINSGSAVEINQTALISEAGCDDSGSAVATGNFNNSDVDFLWDNGETTFIASMLDSDTHMVTVTLEENGTSCSDVGTIFIPTGPTPSLSLGTVNPVTCNGDDDGSINISGSDGNGNLTYDWSGPGNFNSSATSITGLVPGNYSVTVTDEKDCTDVISGILVTEPDVLDFMGVPDTLACFGDANGVLDITPVGGTAPYTFLWSNGETTEDISGLTAGNYSVIITDANGCVKNNQNIRAVREPDELTASVIPSSLACFGDTNGTISVTAGGGTPGYNYEWSDNMTINSPNRTGLAAGTYTVTITDANGCPIEETVNLLQPPLLSATATEVQIASCAGVSDGSASATGTGGTGAYTYVWSTGNNTQVAAGVTTGTHTVTITDANGCTSTASVMVGEDTPISINSQPVNDLDCFGDTDGAIDIAVANGSGGFSFDWTDQSGTTIAMTEDIANLPIGDYNVEVTDNSTGCTVSESFTINEPSEIQATIPTVAECEGESLTVAPTAVGGTGTLTFTWPDNTTGNTFVTEAGNSGVVTITDGNGCSIMPSFTTEAKPAPSATIDPVTLQAVNGVPVDIDLDELFAPDDFDYKWELTFINENCDQEGSTLEDNTPGTFSQTLSSTNIGNVSIGLATYQITPAIVYDGGAFTCYGDTPSIINLEVIPDTDENIFVPNIVLSSDNNWAIFVENDFDITGSMVKVMNRSGAEVFVKELTTSIAWPDVQGGVYWYVIEDGAGNQLKTGAVLYQK